MKGVDFYHPSYVPLESSRGVPNSIYKSNKILICFFIPRVYPKHWTDMVLLTDKQFYKKQ